MLMLLALLVPAALAETVRSPAPDSPQSAPGEPEAPQAATLPAASANTPPQAVGNGLASLVTAGSVPPAAPIPNGTAAQNGPKAPAEHTRLIVNGSRERPTREAHREVGRHGRRGGLFDPHLTDWDSEGWLVRLGLTALLTVGALLLGREPRSVNVIRAPGFEVISPTEARQLIPLEEKFTQLDFVTKIKTIGALRLSANLNKVSLSNRRYGYLMEDKNFRNALLVNRRRVRRTLLKDGDVLDLGDLTLLYRDNRNSNANRFVPTTPPEGKVVIKFNRVRGPLRRGMPSLTAESQPTRSFFVSKNLVFIGRSEENDLIIKSEHVSARHAKVERVGGRYKLQDLSQSGNTFVNGRRVEVRYLREGDEISIDGQRFKFSFVAKPVRERPPQAEATPEEAAGEGEELPPAEDSAASYLTEQEAERS
ncbi:MAG TPA: FHA domain-containing protein [bacterium]|nr:FHA domain-containing protein [bacterium]